MARVNDYYFQNIKNAIDSIKKYENKEYIVIHNGFTFIIAVKIRKDLYDAIDCSQFISDIFKGFYFTVKN